MTRKTYCGNLLWQSGLTLLALEQVINENGTAIGSESGGGTF